MLNPEILTTNNRIKGDQDDDTVNDYTFDSSGNTTKQANGTFTYDAENKQTSGQLGHLKRDLRKLYASFCVGDE